MAELGTESTPGLRDAPAVEDVLPLDGAARTAPGLDGAALQRFGELEARPRRVRAPRPRSRPLVSVLILASYGLLALVYFHGVWADPRNRVVGSPGDTALFIWYLRWVPWAVAHGHNPFFSGYVNAPYGINLMWNTSVALFGVLVAPITALAGPVFSYNLLATASLALSGWSAWYLLRRVAGVSWGAWIGGLIFALSPFLVGQSLGHLHLTAAFLLPLLVLALHEIMIVQQHSARRGGLVLGILAAAQLLIGEELLAITALGCAVSIGLIALLRRWEVRQRAGHALRGLAWGAATFLGLAGVPLAYQFLGPQVVHGAAQLPNVYVADLWGWLIPTPNQWLHPGRSLAWAQHFTARGSEWVVYLGVPLVVALVVITWRLRRRPGVLVASLTALVLCLLALGPSLHVLGHDTRVWLPWHLLGALGPITDLLPVRLMVLVDLIAAGLVGVGFEEVFRRTGGVKRTGLVALLALSVVPLVPRLHFPVARLTVPAFFRSSAVRALPAGSLVVMAPYPEPHHEQVLRWQVAANFRYRLQGGYALAPAEGGKPSFLGPNNATKAVLDALQSGTPLTAIDVGQVVAVGEEMRSEGASSVVVGPMAHQDQVVALFTDLIGRPPSVFGRVDYWLLIP